MTDTLADGMLQQILTLLGAAVVAVALFRRLHLPPILAYLFVGIVVGPNGLALIDSTEDSRYLAEFGVVFLLFTIGLEFSLPQMVAMRRTVFGLGSAQVLITAAVIGGAAAFAGVSTKSAIIAGVILALSSTAIVIKQLLEQLELGSRHGRLAIGILLFQDLAAVPLLVIIPALAGTNGILGPLVLALAKATLIFLAMLAAGRWLLRPLLHEIAAARSPELFTLAVLLISLTAAWATHSAGLSLALGGFLAGMIIGETEYRHQVEADIRPFQDVLLGLFFISIGTLVDLGSLGAHWWWALVITVGLIVTKAAVIVIITRIAGTDPGVALRTGVILAQGGEFGFALLALAIASSLLDQQLSQLVLLAMLLSMAAAPLLIRYNGPLAKTIHAVSYHGNRIEMAGDIRANAKYLHDHVIICGYGRVGQNLARLLEKEGFPYLALDLDPLRLREAVAAGERVHYGDSTQRAILEAAGLHNARLLVVALDDPAATMKILEHTRQLRPNMPVLVRTRDDSYLEHFQGAGATEVVPETLEASLMLGSHMLLLLDIPVAKIIRLMQGIRSDRYRLLRGYFHGTEAAPLDHAEAFRERLHAVTLAEGAYAVDRALAELELEKAGVMVTAVRRGGIRGPQPSPETKLAAGDVIVLYGSPEALERAENLLLKG